MKIIDWSQQERSVRFCGLAQLVLRNQKDTNHMDTHESEDLNPDANVAFILLSSHMCAKKWMGRR